MPTLTTAEQTALVVGWGAAEGGRWWFNSDTGKYTAWDGAALVELN